jgi:hypothetical protein
MTPTPTTKTGPWHYYVTAERISPPGQPEEYRIRMTVNGTVAMDYVAGMTEAEIVEATAGFRRAVAEITGQEPIVHVEREVNP